MANETKPEADPPAGLPAMKTVNEAQLTEPTAEERPVARDPTAEERAMWKKAFSASSAEWEAHEKEQQEGCVKTFCETAEGHLAKLGCHDRVAKSTIEAIARTMLGGRRD